MNRKYPLKPLNQQSISKHLYCPICHQIFSQPHRMQCGHTFCYICIQKWAKQQKKCPICKTSLRRRKPQKDLICDHIINDLQVYCSFNKCQWKGLNSVLKIHMRACEYRPKKHFDENVLMGKEGDNVVVVEEENSHSEVQEGQMVNGSERSEDEKNKGQQNGKNDISGTCGNVFKRSRIANSRNNRLSSLPRSVHSGGSRSSHSLSHRSHSHSRSDRSRRSDSDIEFMESKPRRINSRPRNHRQRQSYSMPEAMTLQNSSTVDPKSGYDNNSSKDIISTSNSNISLALREDQQGLAAFWDKFCKKKQNTFDSKNSQISSSNPFDESYDGGRENGSRIQPEIYDVIESDHHEDRSSDCVMLMGEEVEQYTEQERQELTEKLIKIIKSRDENDKRNMKTHKKIKGNIFEGDDDDSDKKRYGDVSGSSNNQEKSYSGDILDCQREEKIGDGQKEGGNKNKTNIFAHNNKNSSGNINGDNENQNSTNPNANIFTRNNDMPSAKVNPFCKERTAVNNVFRIPSGCFKSQK